METLFTWLHLSDLHVRAPSAAPAGDALLASLREDLSARTRCMSPVLSLLARRPIFAAMMATKPTEDRWAKRVTAWRASGETTDVFAQGKGFEGSTLRWWSSRLGRAEQPAFLRLVPKACAVQVDAGVVVEVGHARVRVKAGFDANLLAQVVAALGGDR